MSTVGTGFEYFGCLFIDSIYLNLRGDGSIAWIFRSNLPIPKAGCRLFFVDKPLVNSYFERFSSFFRQIPISSYMKEIADCKPSVPDAKIQPLEINPFSPQWA
jgi:hypothetical protein